MTSTEKVVLLWGAATGIGGTETRMMEAAQELRRRGVTTVALILGGETDSALSARLRQSCHTVRVVRNLTALRQELKDARAPILVFGLRPSLKARFATLGDSRGLRIYDARNGLEYGRPAWLWTLDRCSQRRIEQYLANSFPVRDHLVRHGIQAGRITVLESALGHEWLKRAPAEKDPTRVLMIGNNRPEKDQELGLRAVSLLRTPIHLTVYTDDSSSLREYLSGASLRRTTSVEFVEGREVTPEAFASASILLHPARSESLPRVILEAMSQGVVPVATDTGDTARIIGAHGWVVPTGDAYALRDAMEAALNGVRDGKLTPDVGSLRGVSQYCDELLQVLE